MDQQTTSISKISKFYLDKDLKVGLIAADTFRAGAVNQLRKQKDLKYIVLQGKKMLIQLRF